MITIGTAILVLRKENEIVLGADSKVTTISLDGLTIACPPRCKIKQAKSLFYASSGMSNYSPSEFSANDNALNSIMDTDTIADAIKLFETVTRAELRVAIEHLKTHHPDIYSHGIHRESSGIVIAGFESGIPIIALRTIYARKYRNGFRVYGIQEYVDNHHQRQRWGTHLGEGMAMFKYANTHPSFWHDDPIGAVRRLLTLQAEATPENVGEPFSIVRITEAGAEWVDRGLC